MPDRLASPRRTGVLLGRGSRQSDEPALHVRAADRRARLAQKSPGAGPLRLISGPSDLREGGAATAVFLLLVFALDLTLWLAIALAVATYAGVTLLRPRREHLEAPADARPERPAEPTAAANTIDSPATGDALEPEAPAGSVAARFGLTRREIEILPLLAQRLTDREIAERLCISPRTVERHVASILAKLELTSRREVAAFAARHALVPLAASQKASE